MVTLSLVHYIFIIMTILILIFLIFKKEIVIPCVVGILLIGLAYTGNIVSSVQILNNAVIASNGELFGIMLVIALVTALSKAMHTVGIDELMIRPLRKVIKKPTGAFWGIGFCMLIVSWLIWPSPAVVLIGALLLPVAGRVKLPAIWAAVSMNIFGHGMALSSDFFIQGAPAITAASAELPVTDVISSSIPLWLVMSVTVAAMSFIMMKRDMKKNTSAGELEITSDYAASEITRPVLAKVLATVVTATFAAIIIAMVALDIQGGDATALVAGAALILTCIITIAGSGFQAALSDTVDYLKEGFVFSVRIFAPVLIIAAFFFLGSEDYAVAILGEGAPAILNDISYFISEHVPVNNIFCVLIEILVGVITGLDGSGFSGLPLVGSIAGTFASTTGLNTASLAALGQITTVWVGGGTIIPWGVVPVAAICGISPTELARKNMIPVITGIVVTGIVAMFLL
ncbi:MAG TPA: hypothetical protein H9717_00550 [Candidatus Eisenbergiella merdipullorum]|uniref:Uncharacterized protein n=1 Tax=Candidatus Eisenbergiella merdipullorum TaxID=2838553 RepID=A0A9D2I2C8_9FIRM|nr:hypothetical protein [Candidatus Eisenbergiella merdipullorum]